VAQDINQWRAFVNMAMNFRFHKMQGIFVNLLSDYQLPKTDSAPRRKILILIKRNNNNNNIPKAEIQSISSMVLSWWGIT
jgi:hypothetical protein